MEIYKDITRSFEERATDLVARMTLEEKIAQLENKTPPIPRLGLPLYNYYNEASHGDFWPYRYKWMDVTSFPVCLAMSQSWDGQLIQAVADAIADECRAYHNVYKNELHFWCPTVNLARDPRNGRSDENFGEDPYLAGKLSAKYIQGMQGEGKDEKYLKTVATPKHFMMNSSENNRHNGSDNADEATIREYYGRVFEYAIREGKAQSIMTSYNRVNGVPASCSDFNLTTLLREEWGFDGFVVSDCGAVNDTYTGHLYSKDLEEACAMTLQAGTDVTCGNEHTAALMEAVKKGYISENIIDRAAIRAITTRFRLGLYDGEGKVRYDSLGKEDCCTEEKQKLAVEIANDSIVLLKNDKNLLPLDKKKMKSVLVVGPNALYRELGGYSCGGMAFLDTVVNVMALDGIKNELADTDVEVKYEKGWCTGKEASRTFHFAFSQVERLEHLKKSLPEDVTLEEAMRMMALPPRYPVNDPDKGVDNYILFERTLEAAKKADYVIVIAGTDNTNAAEERDRMSLELPYGQNEKIKKLLEVNDNTIVVITALGMVTGDFFDKAHTVVNAHFAGQEQGTAIANVLFGKVNPNAKLTATWYKKLGDLPHINDYGIRDMDTLDKKTRTYMYQKNTPRFPFGHGLSYTSFEYSNLELNKSEYDANDTVSVSFDITNTGDRDGREVAQVYIGKVVPVGAHDNKPIRQLKGFAKVDLKAGETKRVTIDVKLSEVTFWNNLQKCMVVENGEYKVEVGTSSAVLPLSKKISVSGKWDAELCTVYAPADRQIYSCGDVGHTDVSATLENAKHLSMREYKPVFVSTDESVATVSDDGTVTAVGSGAATINVSVTYNGKTVTRGVPVAVK